MLVPRFRSLRKAHLKAVLKNPKAKPRHQVLDLKHYTKKKQSNYVDFSQDTACSGL